MTTKEHKEEEVRKIQFSGKSSFMIALPKKWVEEMGLDAGDTVTVVKQENSSLLIAPRSGKMYGRKTEAVMEVSTKERRESITRRLIAIYLLGYGTIQIRAKESALNSNQRDAVKEAMRRHMIGTEVIADSAEGVTLQVLLSYPELSVKNVVKRMFLIAASMHRDAIRSLAKLDKDAASSVMKSDDEVDRFSLYAIRQLNMAAQNDFVLRELELNARRDCLDYRLIVKSVERVADHASRIAQGVLDLERRLNESLLGKIDKMSEFAVGLFEEAGLSLFKGDYGAADRVVEQANLAAKMQEDLLNAIEKTRAPGSNHALPLIVEDIRRTAEYSGDIAEIVINMSTESAVTTAESRVMKTA